MELFHDTHTVFKFVNVFLLFRNYLPLENGMAFHLNTFESPSPKDALRQVWLKLVMVLKKIFNVCQCIFVISLLSPLRKGHDPSFEQT